MGYLDWTPGKLMKTWPVIWFLGLFLFISCREIFAQDSAGALTASRDLLLVYNADSTDSATVLNYYLTHRPMVRDANVLKIHWRGFRVNRLRGYDEQHIYTAFGFTGLTNVTDYETISPAGFTNVILDPVRKWLARNPDKRPQYVVLFLDVPSRVNDSATTAANAPFYVDAGTQPSVSYELATGIAGWRPFITHINLNGTSDCIAYINKLAAIGKRYSPGQLVIGTGAGGYGNTNYYFDDTRAGYGAPVASPVASASLGVWQGDFLASVTYSNAASDTLSGHIQTGSNVAGYLSWGAHSCLGAGYPDNGLVRWTGNSGWWVIETIESFNGERYENHQANYTQWFSSNAFGGTNYSHTPVGAVSCTDEPGFGGLNDFSKYFGLWSAGTNFAACAWTSRRTPRFQAVGDPLVVK